MLSNLQDLEMDIRKLEMSVAQLLNRTCDLLEKVRCCFAVISEQAMLRLLLSVL